MKKKKEGFSRAVCGLTLWGLMCGSAALTPFSCEKREVQSAKDCLGDNFFPERSILHGESVLNHGPDKITSSNKECCKLCKQTPGCRAWNRVRKPGRGEKYGEEGACWMQSEIRKPQDMESEMDSGVIPPMVSGEGKCKVIKSKKFAGVVPYNEPRLLITDNEQDCCGRCREHSPLCYGWMWDKKKKFCSLYGIPLEDAKKAKCKHCRIGMVEVDREALLEVEGCEDSEESHDEYSGEMRLTQGDEFKTQTAKECCGLCGRIRECKSWLWNEVLKGCTLNGDIPIKKPSASGITHGGVAAPKLCYPEECAIEEGVSLHRADLFAVLENVPKGTGLVVDSPEECCKRCQEFPECKSWTFTRGDPTQTPTACWLKNEVPSETMQKLCRGNECVTGVVASRVDPSTLETFHETAAERRRGPDPPTAGPTDETTEKEKPQNSGLSSTTVGIIIVVVVIVVLLALCLIVVPLVWHRKKKKREVMIEKQRKELWDAAYHPAGIREDMLPFVAPGHPQFTSFPTSSRDNYPPGTSAVQSQDTSVHSGDTEPRVQYVELTSEQRMHQFKVLRDLAHKGGYVERPEGLTFGTGERKLIKATSDFAKGDSQVGRVLAGKYIIEAGTRVGQNSIVVPAHQRFGQATPVMVKFFKSKEAYAKELAFFDLQLKSSSIPEVYDQYDGALLQMHDLPPFPCIVMERGTHTLGEFLSKRRNTLDEMDQRSILYKIGAAVNYLHENQLVHRDLKPVNIVMFSNLSWKLIDFGCWGFAGSPAPIQYTLRYAPPELISAHADGRPSVTVHPSSDMWALGLVFWEVLTGDPLFAEDATEEQVMEMLLGIKPLPFERDQSLWHQLNPRPVRRIVQNLLKRDPVQRWNAQRVIENAYFHSGSDTVQTDESGARYQERLQEMKLVMGRVEQKLNQLQEIGIESLKQAVGSVLMVCFSLCEICPDQFRSVTLTPEEIVNKFKKGTLHCTESLLEPNYNVLAREKEDPCFLLRLNKSHIVKISLKCGTDVAIDLPITQISWVKIHPTGVESDDLDCKFNLKSLEEHVLEGFVYWDTNAHKDMTLHSIGDASVDITMAIQVRGSNETFLIKKTMELKMHKPDEKFKMAKRFNRTKEWFSKLPHWAKISVHGTVVAVSLVTRSGRC